MTITKADLAAAEAKGFAAGVEAAAQVADEKSLQWRRTKTEISDAIRALRTPAEPAAPPTENRYQVGFQNGYKKAMADGAAGAPSEAEISDTIANHIDADGDEYDAAARAVLALLQQSGGKQC